MLLLSLPEPDFVKSVCLRKGLFFQSVVTGQDRVLAPVRGQFFFGGTGKWIIVECFNIGLESANRSVSFVREDYLRPG